MLAGEFDLHRYIHRFEKRLWPSFCHYWLSHSECYQPDDMNPLATNAHISCEEMILPIPVNPGSDTAVLIIMPTWHWYFVAFLRGQEPVRLLARWLYLLYATNLCCKAKNHNLFGLLSVLPHKRHRGVVRGNEGSNSVQKITNNLFGITVLHVFFVNTTKR